MQLYFSIFSPGFKWQKQSDGLIDSVCRSLAHLHVLPRFIFHGIFAQRVNISKTETLWQGWYSSGEKIDSGPQAALTNAGSISQCVQSDENYRDDHRSSQSVQQPNFGEKTSGVIYNSHVPFLDECPEASCHLLFGRCLLETVFCKYFHAFSQKHLLADGDVQEENYRGCKSRKSWNPSPRNEK